VLKRLLDISAASIGLLLLWPVFVLLAIAVKLGSKGPVFFRHERVGKGFRSIGVLKYRTMVQDAPKLGGPVTFGDDPRITSFGRLLRKTKLDEIPQLLNVLKGDMSLVGPRPEVSRFVEMFRDDYDTILTVRPGVTDLASIKYRDEQTVLGNAADPEQEYVRVVLPEKIRLAKEYVETQSMWLDIKIIFGTAACLLCDRVSRDSTTK
jgi:lipopolysaccharide/colanic/teichoic acid biosynthesis glycosyltransferase